MTAAARSSRYLFGIACCCLATLGWSLSGLFVRWVPELDGWAVNGYRAPATAICLLVYLALRYRGDLKRHLWPKQPQALLMVGLFFGVGSTLYVYALTMGNVASVSVLCATSPFFAALLAWLFIRERASAVSLAATVVALVGVAIVVQAEMSALATGFLAAVISLGTAFCFAGQTVWLRRHRDLEMMPGIALGGLMVFGFVSVFIGLPQVPLWQVGLLALMGLVQLALPLILFAAGAKHVPVVPAMLIALADVVLNPFWVWLVHGEQPPSGTVAGGALILSAIVGATLFENRRQRLRVQQEG
ncbi:MAG TPA: DMT family transporter [Dongiaceae bacterium]|jgi:drug/metabolite transporter (DMT)-like permease|nr:DMT family transporter [Dongiaceae bacterium]